MSTNNNLSDQNVSEKLSDFKENIQIDEKISIGLDIGSSNLKMVEIKRSHAKPNNNQSIAEGSYNTYELLTYGLYKHNINIDSYWDEGKVNNFAEIVLNIYKSAGFTGSEVTVALPAKYIYVGTMDFEISWDKQMIQAEIVRQSKFFLPYPPDEMRLSWNIINADTSVSSLTGKQRVVINAVPKFVIENITNLLARCQLQGVALENQTISLSRSLLGETKLSTIIVDLGSNSTNLSIIIDGSLRSTFNSMSGTNRLDTILSGSLGIPVEIAKSFKEDLGMVNLYELPKEFEDHIAIVKKDLKAFIDQNIKIAQIPEQIIITGGGVYTAGILSKLQDLGVHVYEGKISSNLKFDEYKLKSFSPLKHLLTTAVGLGMKS